LSTYQREDRVSKIPLMSPTFSHSRKIKEAIRVKAEAKNEEGIRKATQAAPGLKPFKLESAQRHEIYQQQLAEQRRREEEERKKQFTQFRARPLPATIKSRASPPERGIHVEPLRSPTITQTASPPSLGRTACAQQFTCL
jgi:hypothetical protein